MNFCLLNSSPGEGLLLCNFLQIRRLTFGSIKISTADHLSGFLRPSQTFTLQLLVRRCAWRLGMVPGAQRVRSGRLQPLATDMPCGKNNPPLSTPSSCPQFCYFLYGEDGCRMYGRGERPLLQPTKIVQIVDEWCPFRIGNHCTNQNKIQCFEACRPLPIYIYI